MHYTTHFRHTKATLWPQFSSGVEGFEAINKAARWDFQREKVYARTDPLIRRICRTRKMAAFRITRINKVIEYERDAVCPKCKGAMRFQRWGSKTCYDIRFSRFGVRRWVVKYHYRFYHCQSCHVCYGTPAEVKPFGIYGRNLVMFAIYQLIDLCMPQRAVAQERNRLFAFGFQAGEMHRQPRNTGIQPSPGLD